MLGIRTNLRTIMELIIKSSFYALFQFLEFLVVGLMVSVLPKSSLGRDGLECVLASKDTSVEKRK